MCFCLSDFACTQLSFAWEAIRSSEKGLTSFPGGWIHPRTASEGYLFSSWSSQITALRSLSSYLEARAGSSGNQVFGFEALPSSSADTTLRVCCLHLAPRATI